MNAVTTVAPTDAMKFCLECLDRYGPAYAELRWNDSLRFTDTGRTRLGLTLGWIAGLWEAGLHEVANAHADSFLAALDRLNEYGGDDEHPDNVAQTGYGPPPGKYRRFLVELGDDGTRHGFSVLWWRVATKAEADKRREEVGLDGLRFSGFGWNRAAYVPAFNGGLLYHGPRDNSFAITLGHSLWSTHT